MIDEIYSLYDDKKIQRRQFDPEDIVLIPIGEINFPSFHIIGKNAYTSFKIYNLWKNTHIHKKEKMNFLIKELKNLPYYDHDEINDMMLFIQSFKDYKKINQPFLN
jgi:hypothetical protein